MLCFNRNYLSTSRTFKQVIFLLNNGYTFLVEYYLFYFINDSMILSGCYKG